MGCESLTSAMCCEDTCGFSLRARLKVRERKAAEAWPLLFGGVGSSSGSAVGGVALSFFGAYAVKAPFTSNPAPPTASSGE